MYDKIHKEACDRLEAELSRDCGESTILVVGARRSGKTTVCETVMRRMDRHVVRWTPYEEFVAGQVSAVYSGRDTIVFVDDADVLVRLSKGSSVSLMDAMEVCKRRPQVRIVMTALDTKGRVWRSVAGRVGAVQVIPSARSLQIDQPLPAHIAAACVRHKHAVHKDTIHTRMHAAWESALKTAERSVAARLMRNWCDARDADALDDFGDVGSDGSTDTDSETDGCVIRKIAHMLRAK